MLQDTQFFGSLCLDIPGINEVNTEQKYKRLREPFDVVVVVIMDAKQDDNTEDNSVCFCWTLSRTTTKQRRNIPVIILCNKVDDPEDEEQAEIWCPTHNRM
jgi:hypothetical protein